VSAGLFGEDIINLSLEFLTEIQRS